MVGKKQLLFRQEIPTKNRDILEMHLKVCIEFLKYVLFSTYFHNITFYFRCYFLPSFYNTFRQRTLYYYYYILQNTNIFYKKYITFR